jgi:hypothetical protein
VAARFSFFLRCCVDSQERNWWYKDPKGNLQGPFDAEDIIRWQELGYFTNELQVSRDDGATFAPLKRLQTVLRRAAGIPPHDQQQQQQQQLLQPQPREPKPKPAVAAAKAAAQVRNIGRQMMQRLYQQAAMLLCSVAT